MEGYIPKNRIETKDAPIIKEGVDFVFQQNPELKKIGSKEQYSNYLDTVFPESYFKDIVYHSSSEAIIDFKKQEDGLDQFFFSRGKETIWKLLANPDGGPVHQVAVKLDIKNPKIEQFDEDDHAGQTYRIRFAKNEGYDAVFVENDSRPEDSERVVFESGQIYVLGLQSDIEGFNKFVETIDK